MTNYVRGNTIRFAATFTDATGAPYTPTAPILEIEFPKKNFVRGTRTLPLQQDSGEWVASWDSGEAVHAGEVNWTVYSAAPSPKIAADGTLHLTANESNLAAI
jgi:hypothetical protein